MAVHPIHMAGCSGHVVQTASPEGVQWSKRVNHNKQMASISTHIPCERALDSWLGPNDQSLLWLRPAHGHTGPHMLMMLVYLYHTGTQLCPQPIGSIQFAQI